MNNAPKPTPLTETEAAVIAVPGTPAIPTDPHVTTITVIINNVASIAIPFALAKNTTNIVG